MTKRDFYNAILNRNISEEVIAMAQKELRALDNRNSSRAKHTAEKREERYAPIIAKIMDFLAPFDEYKLTTEIAEAIEESSSQTSAVLRAMVAEGKLVDMAVKVKGKGTQKGYRINR